MQLFNGENLDEWYTYLVDSGKDNDPKNVFSVSNGEIRISGEEYGCITTHEEFENYELTLEYKWGELTFAPRETRARDNGVLIHSQGPDGAFRGFWMHSIECQLIEGGTGDIIVVNNGSTDFSATCLVGPDIHAGVPVYDPNGNPKTIYQRRINWQYRDPNWKDSKGFRGDKDVENPIGEWNTLQLIAKKDTLSIYLNGTLVNEAIQVTPSKGRIQIQSEGAEIFYRKIELTPLL